MSSCPLPNGVYYSRRCRKKPIRTGRDYCPLKNDSRTVTIWGTGCWERHCFRGRWFLTRLLHARSSCPGIIRTGVRQGGERIFMTDPLARKRAHSKPRAAHKYHRYRWYWRSAPHLAGFARILFILPWNSGSIPLSALGAICARYQKSRLAVNEPFAGRGAILRGWRHRGGFRQGGGVSANAGQGGRNAQAAAEIWRDMRPCVSGQAL